MINKLCLGTAQLGLKYGIKNEMGRQPTSEESFLLLKSAIEYGINCFDTASAYGNAEDILGEFGIGNHNVKVISKLKANMFNNCNGNEIVSQIQSEVELSLAKLKRDFLDGYLLHDVQDFYSEEIMYGLQLCKDKGLVKNIGVSIYEPVDALAAVKSDQIDYIQIPYNVFDQRLDQTEFFTMAKEKNVTVFARSSFLQGLLLMNIDKIPENLYMARPYLKKFHAIIEKYGYNPMEASFLFSYCHKGIDRVVFGVDTKEQLSSNLAVLDRKQGFQPCYDELMGTFLEIERKIIVPSLWDKV